MKYQTDVALRVTLILAGSCFHQIYGIDVNATYQECIRSEKEHEAAAVQQYTRCLQTLPDPKSKCDSHDISKCIVQLAYDTMFQKCIGSSNLETLSVVGKILQDEYDFFCSSDGLNATQTFKQNQGPQCQIKFSKEILNCYEHAKYPIAGRSTELEMLAGFAIDKKYCSVLQQFDKCEMETIASCNSSVKEFISRSHDRRWHATPCTDLLNSANGISMLASTITLILCALATTSTVLS